MRRSNPGRGENRLGRRGRTGLVSTIGPVAVGVVLAFAWNMTVSQSQRAAETGSGVVTPRVGLTVEEAAAQAWASATPHAAAGAATDSRPSPGRNPIAGHPRGAGGACSRVTRAPERTMHAYLISACAQRERTPGHAPGPFGINS